MTEDLIDFLGSLSIQQAFAIGRIAEQDAIILRQYQAPDILTAKLNQIIHMSLFGILSAQFYGCLINIKSAGTKSDILSNEATGSLAFFLKNLFGKTAPLLTCKTPHESRADTASFHRGFHQQRTGSAHGIQNQTVLTHMRQINHTGR